MFKLFTLEGARRVLPDVDTRLGTLKEAVRDLEDMQARFRADTEAPLDATVDPLATRQELAFLVSAVHDARRHLAELGVMLADDDMNVVEIPARVDGEVVHLVWEPGQRDITHYHRLTGDTHARPISPRSAGATPVDPNAA